MSGGHANHKSTTPKPNPNAAGGSGVEGFSPDETESFTVDPEGNPIVENASTRTDEATVNPAAIERPKA